MKASGVKPYLSMAKMMAKDLLTQRFEFVGRYLSLPFEILTLMALWAAVGSQGVTNLGGFSIIELTAYSIMAVLVKQLASNEWVANQVEEDITDGGFVSNLCRPIEHWKYRLSIRLGNRALMLPITALILLSVILMFHVPLPNLAQLLLTIALIIMAGLFMFFEFYCVGLLSFWIERTYGIRLALRFFQNLVSGVWFPLTILPFSHVSYTPTALLMNKISLTQGIQGLIILTVWTIVAYFVAMKLWKKGLKKYDGKM